MQRGQTSRSKTKFGTHLTDLSATELVSVEYQVGRSQVAVWWAGFSFYLNREAGARLSLLQLHLLKSAYTLCCKGGTLPDLRRCSGKNVIKMRFGRVRHILLSSKY